MIPLFQPHMPELPELDRILKSGSLAYGKYTKEFEEKLKAYFGTPFVIVTNSFNTAISVAITTLGLSWGDEIIASPMACLASTQPYASSGLTIRWCDVDHMRGTLDPEDLKKKISSKTKAIVHNHFCGYPGYIDEINAIANAYGIPVIDDGIECFGSLYKGKKIGNCGTAVTVFSFTAVRMPNTIDGGAVVFGDRAQYEKSLLVRDCGIDRACFRDARGEINPDCDITDIGYSATMSNVNGYIGCRQMEQVDRLLEQQRRNGEFLAQWVDANEKLQRIDAADTQPNYWIFGLLSNDKQQAIEDFRSKGLYASGVHINNNRYSIFQNKAELPGVTDFYGKFLAIPSGWWMDGAQCGLSSEL